MSKAKALFLTVIIDGLLLFVLLWAKSSAPKLYMVYSILLMILGGMTLVSLTFAYITTPEKPATRSHTKKEHYGLIYGEEAHR